MNHVRRSALLPYSAKKMYELVNDVHSYPEFIPWCVNTDVEDMSVNVKQATMYFAKRAIKTSVTTKNELIENKRISMHLESGPFKNLTGVWQFEELDENVCKVELDMQFEFSNHLYEITLGPIFNQVANKLVSAFTDRAEELYGQ